jgi:hypothetical protein
MPVHVEYLARGTEIVFRRTMAVEAPFHAQRLGLVDFGHLVHRAVTAVAANASVHMDRMVEIGVVRKAMDLNPRDRLTRLPAFANRG